MPSDVPATDDELAETNEIQPRERLVTALAVGAVAIASLLAALMHAPQDAPQAPGLTLAGTIVTLFNPAGRG